MSFRKGHIIILSLRIWKHTHTHTHSVKKSKQNRMLIVKRKLECEAFTVDKGRKRKCDDESIFFHLYATNVAECEWCCTTLLWTTSNFAYFPFFVLPLFFVLHFKMIQAHFNASLPTSSSPPLPPMPKCLHLLWLWVLFFSLSFTLYF